MEHIPSETGSCLANQGTPRLLWNMYIHYRVSKSPPSASVLSHVIHFTHSPDLCKIRLNIVPQKLYQVCVLKALRTHCLRCF
jgi:hypothetical protein